MSIATRNQAIDKYVANRMARSGGRDDRCDAAKKSADAALRGKIGCHKANEVIRQIDKLKSWR